MIIVCRRECLFVSYFEVVNIFVINSDIEYDCMCDFFVFVIGIIFEVSVCEVYMVF